MKLKPIVSAIIVTAVVVTVMNITLSKPAHEEAPVKAADQSYLMRPTATELRDKIEMGAAAEITAETMPRMFEKMGAEEIKRTRAGVWAAMYRTAADRRCDKVAYASLGDESQPGKPVFFAMCENGVVNKFSEFELKDNDGEWFVQENAPSGLVFWMSQKAFTPAPKAK